MRQLELKAPLVGYEITDGNVSCFISDDWDYPMLAGALGAGIVCDCGRTDGTIDCEHKTASGMIEDAANWLWDNLGGVTMSDDDWNDRYALYYAKPAVQ